MVKKRSGDCKLSRIKKNTLLLILKFPICTFEDACCLQWRWCCFKVRPSATCLITATCRSDATGAVGRAPLPAVVFRRVKSVGFPSYVTITCSYCNIRLFFFISNLKLWIGFVLCFIFCSYFLTITISFANIAFR